ncbi:STAS domain-containing protein [Streptomyces sp. NPDC058701]|uniref:STAS domain-containing protein n=1 Tax=Streptomyces sp. NPDC058701 TaxID=3346608 RepID=UPI00364B29B6
MIEIPGPLRLTRVDTDDAVRIELHGDFGHQDAGALLDVVGAVLAEPDAPLDLHVDCAGVASVDSSGLSVLLMARRLTGAAGVRLHLDHRPVQLDRMLTVTGTLNHLTGQSAGKASASPARERRSARSEESIPARSSGPDATT